MYTYIRLYWLHFHMMLPLLDLPCPSHPPGQSGDAPGDTVLMAPRGRPVSPAATRPSGLRSGWGQREGHPPPWFV